MKFSRTKTVFTTLALSLLLIISAMLIALPIVNAHVPPMTFKTYAYITADPDPVGMGQEVLLVMWLDKVPPTATGGWGDRWENLEVEVTKPNGETETIPIGLSDPIGFAYTMYTPDQLGDYTFEFSFPGQTLEGKNMAPFQFLGAEFIGDYFEASSAEATLTVQEDAIPSYPLSELPTDYWDRPINAQNKEWWSIAGNWLKTPANFFSPYTEGPETAHILWANPLTFGGLVGGEFGDHAFHGGNAYEGKWWPPVIIGGILYYNEFASSMAYDEYFGMYNYYMSGVHAVDLRTGEEVWYNPDMRLDFGQIYYYSSMNQHGALAYLWQQEGTTLICYDAFTGRWFCNVTNAPAALSGMFGSPNVFGPNGELLVPTLGPTPPPGAPPQPLSWLAMWDLNAISDFTGAYDLNTPTNGTAGQMWRPFNKVVDGQKGFVWNVTLPPEVTHGSINHILRDEYGNPDRIIGSWTNTTGIAYGALPIGDTEVWCVSLKEGEQGKLLWKKVIKRPAGATLNMGSASLEEGVFTIWCPQTRQNWGYSVETGNKLWGPTDPQPEWDMLWATGNALAYGKFFSVGMGGTLHCYDATDGTLEWTYDLSSPYYLEAKWGGKYPYCVMRIADEKIYLFTGEHSPDDPKERGTPLACVDIDGNELWTIPFYASHWAANPAIADGILVYLNTYDNLIYAFGKGKTVTTVTAPDVGVPVGSSVMIRGTVTDQSPGAEGTPAISDEDMSEWMEYLYMQQPIPMGATGVEVTLDAVDADGSFTSIGTATSDQSGFFSYMWTPEEEGEYTIIATFEGSDSYYASYAETAVGVVPAPTPAGPIEPEKPAGLTTTQIAIIAAVVVVAIAGIGAFWVFRKRK